jgi:hypothetical protein
MPKNEIVFGHIFERALPATREALKACRIYAVHAIRNRIGIALQIDDYGYPITVATKKSNTNSDWFLTGDIRVRFLSKRSALSTYEQHRAPVKGRDEREHRLLTYGRRISQTILPTGHIGNKSNEASLHTVFVSRKLLRGKDNGEIPTLFRDNLKDIYEDIILNNTDDF